MAPSRLENARRWARDRRPAHGGRQARSSGTGRGARQRTAVEAGEAANVLRLVARRCTGSRQPLLELFVLAHQLLIASLQPGHRWKCRWLLCTAAAGPLAGPPRLEESKLHCSDARNCAQESWRSESPSAAPGYWLQCARGVQCVTLSAWGASACCHPDARSVLVARGSSRGRVQSRGSKTAKS
eukprot:scaffold25163_cov63-Phaeocystis_antarctica.AAC.4